MWPMFFNSSFLTDYSQKPDVHLVHSRFNPYLAEAILPKNETFYVTILRHPVAQWVSIFIYFRKLNYRRFDSIFSAMNYFIDTYTGGINDTKNGAYGRNSNFFDCGIGDKYLTSDSMITEIIKWIDEAFDFVFINELWEESILLLKEKMCLSLDEVIAFDANVRLYKIPELPKSLQDKILKFNDADHQLYQYFYQKVKKEASKFSPSDFENLRRRKKFWENTCILGREAKIAYSNRKYLGYRLKNNVSEEYRTQCELMTMGEIQFFDMYKQKMIDDFLKT
ncbi:Galactosylceramide sulfotransferase [Thelohanellus kitauei]|uniref:Galactosylceramide sulfotransferase n=1 Tax=Thelohanellus kitauei TaxID=669202 RepID=A0A0C2MPJ6_THEKT|nr:Galactosylceramide sulfotransferase [Thelohanellus kitauei]